MKEEKWLRGERLKSERTEAESIYNIFKEKLEIEDKGKIVAIDMDSKNILAKDYDLNFFFSIFLYFSNDVKAIVGEEVSKNPIRRSYLVWLNYYEGI